MSSVQLLRLCADGVMGDIVLALYLWWIVLALYLWWLNCKSNRLAYEAKREAAYWRERTQIAEIGAALHEAHDSPEIAVLIDKTPLVK